jgi:hypothetical protein
MMNHDDDPSFSRQSSMRQSDRTSSQRSSISLISSTAAGLSRETSESSKRGSVEFPGCAAFAQHGNETGSGATERPVPGVEALRAINPAVLGDIEQRRTRLRLRAANFLAQKPAGYKDGQMSQLSTPTVSRRSSNASVYAQDATSLELAGLALSKPLQGLALEQDLLE